MLRKRRIFALLARCNEGVTAIEFALLAPVLLLLVMGIIEFSVIMFVSVMLEGSTDMTARLGSTGYVPGRSEPGSGNYQQCGFDYRQPVGSQKDHHH